MLADLLEFYTSAKIQPTKKKAIGANLQPLQLIGMANIPIIIAGGDAVHAIWLYGKEVSRF